MSELFLLTEEQVKKMQPFFPKTRGVPRVDDRKVLSGIIFVNRNGLSWRDAPAAYGPYKTLYNRWYRWNKAGIFTKMQEALAAEGADADKLMIDATHHLEVHPGAR